MPQLDELMSDVPQGILDGTGQASDNQDDDTEDEELENQDDLEQEDDDQADADADDASGDEDDSDDDQEDYFTAGDEDDEEEEPAKPAPVVQAPKTNPNLPAGLSDEGQYILTNLPKLQANIIVPTADGKGQEVKQVEVYGWGDLPRNMVGFQSTYEQGVFTASAQNNEMKARELQQQFQQQKIQADTEAYTVRENRAIARDLKTMRQQGIFPKFKGIPGTPEFNGSAGAKEFDRVVAFMNEQNDESGKAAQKGDAFYHISFRQAYQMLHPEKFDKTKQEAQRKADRQVARRVKGGGNGSRPAANKQVSRVSNITDLADEFAAFAGSSS